MLFAPKLGASSGTRTSPAAPTVGRDDSPPNKPLWADDGNVPVMTIKRAVKIRDTGVILPNQLAEQGDRNEPNLSFAQSIKMLAGVARPSKLIAQALPFAEFRLKLTGWESRPIFRHMAVWIRVGTSHEFLAYQGSVRLIAYQRGLNKPSSVSPWI